VGDRTTPGDASRLRPVLTDGEFVVVCTDQELAGVAARASVREDEGYSYVIERDDADRLGLAYDAVWAWITLGVTSSLGDLGLTALVSRALAGARISCNILAGYHHDHLLVPVARAPEARRILEGLSWSGGARSTSDHRLSEGGPAA
jgi:hypothetical protein